MRLAVVLFPITVLMIAGCAPVAGVVTGAVGSRVGSKAPDIQYVTVEGRPSSFNWARCPIALVAFTSSESPAGYTVNPSVADLADRLWDLPVTVAQLTLPPEDRSHGVDRAQIGRARKSGMMFLVDADRLAWNAYGQPAPGTLLLLRDDGTIVMTGSLGDPEAVLREARRLGEIERRRPQIEQGVGL